MQIPKIEIYSPGTNALAAFQGGQEQGRANRLRELAGQAFAPGADRQALQQQAAQAGGFQGAQQMGQAFQGLDAQKVQQAQEVADDMMRRVLPIAQAQDPAQKQALFQEALRQAAAEGKDVSAFSRMSPDQAVEAAYAAQASLQDQLARAGLGAPGKPQGPMNVGPGGSVFDPVSGKVVYQAPFAPRDPGTQVVEGKGGFFGINKGDMTATPITVGGQPQQVNPAGKDDAIIAEMNARIARGEPEAQVEAWAQQQLGGIPSAQLESKPTAAQLPKPADPMKVKKLADMARKEKMLLNNTRSDMDATVKLIDDILAKKDDFGGVTGMGAMGASIPGTDWADIAAKIQRLQARSAFGTLAEMRAASPTGGALGAVSERELAFLQNAAAALQNTQSPAALAQALKDYKAAIKASRDRLNSGFSDYYNSALTPTAEDANAAVGPIAPPDQFSGFRVLD